MVFLSGEKTAEFFENITYVDTQIADQGMHLTLNKIFKIEESGEIDFGGGERKDAEITELEPSLRNPDDDYGWWELESGTYLMEYNESLTEEKITILQPLERLTRNSATHPTKVITELEKIPLFVGEKGIAIKENSRMSRVLIFRD